MKPATQLRNVFNRVAQSRRGVVLIVVLVLVVMIALAGFGFLAAMSTEYEAARLEGSQLQSMQTMASAESSLLWFVSLPEQKRQLMGGTVSNPLFFRGRVVAPVAAAGSAQRTPSGSAGLTDPSSEMASGTGPGTGPDDRWRFSVIHIDHASGQGPVLRFGLRTESSKLHLASVLRWDQAKPGQGRISLMKLPGMTEALADSILDWIDADEDAREYGAESEYYLALNQPYRAANSIPQHLEELLYVKGVTRQHLFGTNGISSPPAASSENLLSSAETTTDVSASQMSGEGMSPESTQAAMASGWVSLLTVLSAERNQDRSGKPRVNLSNSDLSALESLLTGNVPSPLVRYILLARQYGTQPVNSGFGSTGTDPLSAPFVRSTPASFPLTSLADLIDTQITIAAPAGPIRVASPLQSESPDFGQMFGMLMDRTTTLQDSVVVGRIDLLTAPEAVLRAIPSMPSDTVAQLLTRRTEFELPPSSPGWILNEKLIDSAGFRNMLPELTIRGDVFEAEIIVFRAIGGPVLRRKIVLDAASAPARRLQWSNRTTFSQPYSLQQLLPPSVEDTTAL
ncbi:MAG: general secretion pathway protein GspK [Planctomyces sp.]|nr:general secretion pathway protein GspK [Planctomyces sp.]